MIVCKASPDPRLANVVKFYQSREAHLGRRTTRIALPARTDVLIEFYFTEPHRLELQADNTHERAPWIAAVGPQTHRRVDLLLSGRLDTFTIHLAPTGFHALTGVPMTELTDAGIDAAAVLEPAQMRRLHDALAQSARLDARARIADAFLLDLLDARRRPYESPVVAIGLAAILRAGGNARGHRYAIAAGVSERHFRRLFEQQVGMAPKLYARIVRLEAAMRERDRSPTRTWTDIAHQCGFFDHAHMDKDFHALTGAAPTHYRPRGA